MLDTVKISSPQTCKRILTLAGPRGIEPRLTVLETVVLPLNYRPNEPIVAKKLLLGFLVHQGGAAPVALYLQVVVATFLSQCDGTSIILFFNERTVLYPIRTARSKAGLTTALLLAVLSRH